jgi:xanthine dehydrogenase YagS FAD-binding subunit
MKPFEYASPETLEDAIALLGDSWGETEVLAGGTDLLSAMKQYIVAPKRLVSLKNIKGLNGIRAEGNAIEVGAMTRLHDFAEHAEIKAHFPGLARACTNIGAPQVLNMGTVGGDLLQRPRCWYYRNGMGLFGMKDGKSLVEIGDNRYHAIYGNDGPAKFVHASSLAPGLIALDASVTLQGANGKRTVKAAEFFRTPTSETERESVIAPNEILTGVSIPKNGLKNGLYEVRQRQGLDWPMVAAFVAFKSGTSASDARVVLGHVAPTPWVSEAAAAALNGKDPANDAARRSAGSAAAADASPLSRNGYKVLQVRVAIARAIEAAIA